MTEMVERVSRAIREARFKRDGGRFAWHSSEDTELARAAIEAMREPTAEMWAAHWKGLGLSKSEIRAWMKSDLRKSGPHESGAVSAYRAMIDAALSEGSHRPGGLPGAGDGESAHLTG